MGRYFCGWYFRCQSDHQTLAVIPSYHKTATGNSCEIQLITDSDAFHISFPYADFEKNSRSISIADNHFGTDGIKLNIQKPDFYARGNLHFGPFTEIRYDIMGPFKRIPFMQCRHNIYSMHHRVSGEITINGVPYCFQNAIGYMEGDRGRSFPRKYVWTQCSFPDEALMLSIADIPLGEFHFTGVIGIVYLRGREYRLATYLGAKAIKIAPDEIIVKQGNYTLFVKPDKISGYPLHAPVSGAMNRVIHEHPSCKIYYRLEEGGIPLLEWEEKNAAFEYEY